jgi:superfamily I DNA/RNA helicase
MRYSKVVEQLFCGFLRSEWRPSSILTTEQVKRFADAILPKRFKELDGELEDRTTVSILSGPPPDICGFKNNTEEAEGIAKWLNSMLSGGYEPADIAILARTHSILKERVEPALSTCGMKWRALSDEEAPTTNEISIGTMHRAKGLEFTVVVVAGCDESILPKASVLATLSDEVDRNTFIAQEKCLFYVACTRARERLLVTYVGKPSNLISQAFMRA